MFRLFSLVFLFFLFPLIFASPSGDDEKTRAALIDLYEALDGPNWVSSKNWNSSSTTYCVWFGLSCAPGTANLVEIRLKSVGLSGSVRPLQPGSFPFLETIHFQKNPNLLTIWEDLQFLPHLIEFDLSDTGIEKIPDKISTMKNLQQLRLNNIKIQEINDNIGKLLNLLVLEMKNNKALVGAGKMIPASFSSLTSLETLDLSENDFHIPFPTFIGNFYNLSSLDLSGNPFLAPHEFPLELLNCPNMRHLAMSRCLLGGILPNQITQWKSLESLALAHNQFTGSLPIEWEDLDLLQTLNLDSNQLTDVSMDFSVWPALQTCSLQENNFNCPIPQWTVDTCSALCDSSDGPDDSPAPSHSGLSSSAIAGIISAVALISFYIAYVIYYRRTRQQGGFPGESEAGNDYSVIQ